THTEPRKHSGSCHCGAVRYAVEVDASRGTQCNCSICTKVHGTHAIVKPEAFTLRAGEGELGMYQFGQVAQRYFCRTCGIHCFGRGVLEQVGGAYVSVNLNTLDDIDPGRISVAHWDGRHDNWMAGLR